MAAITKADIEKIVREVVGSMGAVNTALNNGLIKFPGVVLFTSQDHQFIQTIANRIMEITAGGLIDKMTTYDEYLESDEFARKRQVMNMESTEDK